MKFSHLAPAKEEKIASFVPILHLSNSGKVFLRQPIHFEDIHMTLKIHDDEVKELENELGIMGDEDDEQLTDEDFSNAETIEIESESINEKLSDEDFVDVTK